MVIIEINLKLNVITNLCIAFTNIENIGILMNNIIKSFELFIIVCNWYREKMDIIKTMMKSKNSNIIDVYIYNEEYH